MEQAVAVTRGVHGFVGLKECRVEQAEHLVVERQVCVLCGIHLRQCIQTIHNAVVHCSIGTHHVADLSHPPSLQLQQDGSGGSAVQAGTRKLKETLEPGVGKEHMSMQAGALPFPLSTFGFGGGLFPAWVVAKHPQRRNLF